MTNAELGRQAPRYCADHPESPTMPRFLPQYLIFLAAHALLIAAVIALN
jgi:hypothetical protein